MSIGFVRRFTPDMLAPMSKKRRNHPPHPPRTPAPAPALEPKTDLYGLLVGSERV
jgi:hypothetical protein